MIQSSCMINKVKPQKITGTITLPNKKAIEIDNHAVDNNDSPKSDKEFISSLKKAVGKGLFPKSLDFHVQ